MGSTGTCPRGHALEENAVYCTVCWVRVEPEDAAVVAARRRRQRRIWLPMLAVSAILVGVAIGGSAGLFGGRTASTSVVAAGTAAPVEAATAIADTALDDTALDDTSPADTSPAPSPAASAPADTASAPAPVAVPPMAATVADIRICVPADTRSLVVRARVGTEGGWQVLSSDATIGGTGDCRPDEVAAGISLPDLPTGVTKLKAVARDAAGAKLARIPLDPSSL